MSGFREVRVQFGRGQDARESRCFPLARGGLVAWGHGDEENLFPYSSLWKVRFGRKIDPFFGSVSVGEEKASFLHL